MEIVGIDLGTTYSAVSYMYEDGKPRILENQDGEKTTPSVVMFQNFGGDDEPLVGTQAKQQAKLMPEDMVQYIKRFIGDPNWKFDSSSGKSYSPEEISAIILKRLKTGAELALGKEVTHAVITVPAYFDDVRRTATRNAGKIAGLEVVRVLNEPTAAALAYGFSSDNDGMILVYDLGGGTFDATLMKKNGDNYEVLATDGDRNLGGFDFDNLIINHVYDHLSDKGIDTDDISAEMEAEIREKAEQAKRALSSVDSTLIHLVVNKQPIRIELTKEKFDELATSLVKRTIEITEDVLDESNVSWSDLDKVLMIGGSTRMRIIKETLEEKSGKELKYEINPDEAVSLGAAVQAGIELVRLSKGELDGVEVTEEIINSVENVNVEDVTSQSLGTIAVDGDTGKHYNCILIYRNSKIPAGGESNFLTLGRTSRVKFEITEGDDTEVKYVTVLGETIVDMGRIVEKDHPLTLKLSYDIDQTIYGEIFDGENGKLLKTFEINRDNNMTESQLQIASQNITDLKIY